MSNVTKLEFIALDILRNNYLSWNIDVEIHLETMNLWETLNKEIICDICGHWSRICCIPKHLINLYQASQEQNVVETNLIHKDDSENHNAYVDVNIYLVVSDFFENSNKIENMLSGGIFRDD